MAYRQRKISSGIVTAVAGLLVCSGALAQTSSLNLQPPSLLQAHDPFMGSVTTAPVTDEAIKLSLDDAIHRSLEHNLGLIQQQQTERLFQAQVLSAKSVLTPTVKLKATSGVDEFNLLAFGFKPALVSKLLPGYHLNPFIKVDVTQAEATVDQTLFSMQAIDLYRASVFAVRAEDLNTLSAHGTVIYNAVGSYLQVLSDMAMVENSKAQLATSQRLQQQTKDRDAAGTATHLDVLRASVQVQNDEQALEQEENALAKDRIALNRVIGLAPEQKVQLTDAAPYADLAARTLEELRTTAYNNRKDYLALLSALHGYELQSRSARYERMPVLSFSGNYGVTGVTHDFYHGTMYAAGKIEIPLFKEARLRGDRDVADAQLGEARSQLASLRADVDAQIRASLLDVEAAQKLVKVAESNRDLAREELDQSQQRYGAGVDDNLPVVQAQAAVAAANSQWVTSLYQYNLAKLALARNAGILESQYHQYLGE